MRKKNAPWFGKAGENSTIWDSPSPKFIIGGADEDKYDHPTQKPIDLMRRPILNHIRHSKLVYDPFLGSGTTLAAAELNERICYGMELDSKYADVIVARWQTLTGKKATPFRVVVSHAGEPFDLATATCTRTIMPDGGLMEIVNVNGSGHDLSDDDLETFIQSFPVEVSAAR